jgi:2-dehydro-3-deoxygalactonokinase
MASSSVGWQELPYARVPASVDGRDLVAVAVEPLACPSGPHAVTLLSGLRTDVDIMRGEETQLVGLFQLSEIAQFAERSRVIMPGTHSKHVQIDRGRITDFTTYMTGELFDVLTHHSLLSHSVAPVEAPAQMPPVESGDFVEGVLAARHRPLAATLFRVRTRQVLDQRPATENREYLSGLLIGSELATLADPDQAQIPLVLCATASLAARYAVAAAALGLGGRLYAVGPEVVDRLPCLAHGRFVSGTIGRQTALDHRVT